MGEGHFKGFCRFGTPPALLQAWAATSRPSLSFTGEPHVAQQAEAIAVEEIQNFPRHAPSPQGRGRHAELGMGCSLCRPGLHVGSASAAEHHGLLGANRFPSRSSADRAPVYEAGCRRCKPCREDSANRPRQKAQALTAHPSFHAVGVPGLPNRITSGRTESGL